MALKKFECYLHQHPYKRTVYTDHNPIVFLERMRNTNQRLLCRAILIQQYNMDILYIRGVDNTNANAFSRDPSWSLLSSSVRLSEDFVVFLTAWIGTRKHQTSRNSDPLPVFMLLPWGFTTPRIGEVHKNPIQIDFNSPDIGGVNVLWPTAGIGTTPPCLRLQLELII